MPSRILFAPIHGPALLEMLPVAEKLAADGFFEPVFLVFREIPDRQLRYLEERHLRQIRVKSVNQIEGEKTSRTFLSNVANQHKQPSRSFRKRFSTYLLSWKLFSFIFYWIKFSRLLKHSRGLLMSEDVAAVLVMGDRHVGWETALIKAANERRLATMIVPFAVSDPESDLEGRLRKADMERYRAGSLIDGLIRRTFPDWVRDSKEGPFYFLPAGEALAAKVVGIMPDKPWSIGGGAARRMAVESIHALEIYLQQGIPPEKMVVTGKPSMDQVFSRMQSLDEAALRSELGIGTKERIILCSVPQLAEHRLLSWEAHWRETEFLFAALSKQPGTVLVLSLHPQSDPEKYRDLAERHGAVIAPQRIYDLIPICDFLVATYSSVVVQAIGCGKPAIVVDFYGLNFTYYDQESGVVVLKERDKLLPTVKRLIEDHSFYEELADAQRHSGPDWILLDGNCTQRFVYVLYQMIKNDDNGHINVGQVIPFSK